MENNVKKPLKYSQEFDVKKVKPQMENDWKKNQEAVKTGAPRVDTGRSYDDKIPQHIKRDREF